MWILGIPPISPHPYPSLSNHGKAALMTSLPGGNPRQRSVLTSVHCRHVTVGRRYLVATAAVNIQGARPRECFGYARGSGCHCPVPPSVLLSLRRTLMDICHYISTPLFNYIYASLFPFFICACMELQNLIIQNSITLLNKYKPF